MASEKSKLWIARGILYGPVVLFLSALGIGCMREFPGFGLTFFAVEAGTILYLRNREREFGLAAPSLVRVFTMQGLLLLGKMLITTPMNAVATLLDGKPLRLELPTVQDVVLLLTITFVLAGMISAFPAKADRVMSNSDGN